MYQTMFGKQTLKYTLDRPLGDALKSHYQAIVSARYDNQPGPSSGSGSAAQFGGTPLTSGEFAPEEDQDLHIVLRVIRWFALMLAAIILGREWFRVLSHY